MELTEIAPQVYACVRPDRGLGWSNSGIVAHGAGLVVDTFWDLPSTRAAMDLYAEVHPDPVGRLLNTHHNGDHCWGNQLYAELGTEIIGHRRCAEHFEKKESPAFFRDLVASDPATLAPSMAGFAEALSHFDFEGITLTPPTTLIDDDTELDLGGTRVRLLSLGPAHTAGDVAVHLPEHGVVFTGDLLFHQCTPIGWEGTTAQWVTALDRLVALDPMVVVPGHGPLATTEGLLAMRDYLLFVQEQAREGFEAGRTPLECALGIELGPPYDGWNEPERLAFGVHRAYREMRGGAWDAPVDTGAVFGDMAVLRRHFGR